MRKKSKERINPNAKKHNLKFGWCITGHHSTCFKAYTDWNEVMQECSCDCHKEEK